MKENAATAAGTHQRSPNYPANSLAESLVDVRKLFESEKRTALSQESVVKAIGYGGLNGASRTKLASLRKYGLIEPVGDRLQVSHLAVRIIHSPQDSADYLAAVREAALRPDVFKEFLETHREASEQSIISELIVKRSYSPEGAKLFARSFRETISFAKLDQEQYPPSDGADKKKAAEARKAEPSSKDVKTPQFQSDMQPGEIAIPLSGGRLAKIPFPMNEEDFDLFSETIRIWKKRLVPRFQSIPPSIKLPANALWKNNDTDTDKPVKIVAVMGEQNGERYYQSDDGTGIPGSQLEFSEG